MTVDKPFRIMYNSRIVAVRPAGGRRFLQINGRGTAMALGSPGAAFFQPLTGIKFLFRLKEEINHA